MGTNFYMSKKKPSNDELMKFIQDKEKDGENAVDSLIEMLRDNREEIHICKRSSGWHILYDHNYGKYWNEPTRESIQKYQRENGMVIHDEYGEEYTEEEFWNEMDEWEASRDDLWDSIGYEREYPKDHHYHYSHSEILDYDRKCQFNLINFIRFDENGRLTGTDFWNDGMRWAISSDFC